jgi:hypothetical protein
MDEVIVAFNGAIFLLFLCNLPRRVGAALRNPGRFTSLYLAIQGLVIIALMKITMIKLAVETGYLASIAQNEFHRSSERFAAQERKEKWWQKQLLQNMDIEQYVY